MAPPELPRDVPGADRLQPVERDAAVHGRVEGDAAVADRLGGRLRELVHPYPPLQRDERLDARAGALAVAYRVAVRLALFELVVLLQPGDDTIGRLLLGEAGKVARCRVHAAVEADHRRLGQTVAPADLEVDGIVAGRDLEGAGAELRLDRLVGDDGDAPPDHRHDNLLADELREARIVRVHRDGHVGEDRRRAHGGDGKVAGAVGERIADVRERVVDVLVEHLEVGDRRPALPAPVDDAVVAVDEAPLVQVDEELEHGPRVALVHREALARVVERRAERAELAHDRLAGLLQPGPDLLDEGVAAELVPGQAAAAQVLLDDGLRGDARMVVAGLPERVEAAHPVPANEDVLDRPVERVPHVQRARDVGRRNGDDVRRPRGVGNGPVEALLLPGALPAPFDAVGTVERIHPGDSTEARHKSDAVWSESPGSGCSLLCEVLKF